MARVYLAPRSNETSHKNFESTIAHGRPYSFIEPYLTTHERAILSKYDPIRVWGNKESLRSRWEPMKPGDYVLFYRRGGFYYSGRVVLTKFNKELGEKLWPADKDGKPWPCLFFLDQLREINIPIKLVQELAGFAPTWDRVMGFMPLNERALKAIESKFGSIESFISQDMGGLVEALVEESRDEQLEEEEGGTIDKAKILAEAELFKTIGPGHELSDRPRMVRKENRQQKKRVAHLEDYSCQICGWTLEWTNKEGKKVFRIDIDHIIDKGSGGGEEISNLWALCPNHHAEKTHGVLRIDPKLKKVFRNNKEVQLHHDGHLKRD